MEKNQMKKFTFLGILFFLSINLLLAQPSIDKIILDGKKQLVAGTNVWNEETIMNARSLFERLKMQKDKLDLVHYYIGLADYRLAARYFLNQDPKAQQYLDDGIKNLELALKKNKKLADAHALLSSLYGQKISMDPALAMTLGPQSWTSMDNAMKLEPKNPRVLMLKAMSTYFAPEQFGGSKPNGLKEMETAIATFRNEKLDNPLLPDWGIEDALMMMATWKMEGGDNETASKLIEETLKINPNFGWAKEMKGQLSKEK
jgi:tetratricopeptide (TPR) repeat protein